MSGLPDFMSRRRFWNLSFTAEPRNERKQNPYGRTMNLSWFEAPIYDGLRKLIAFTINPSSAELTQLTTAFACYDVSRRSGNELLWRSLSFESSTVNVSMIDVF